MTAASAAGQEVDWSVGSAIAAAWSVLVGNFVPFVGTALIAALPNILFSLLVGASAARGVMTTLGFTSIVVAMVVTIFIIQTLVYGSVQALRGRKVSIGDCLTQGLTRLPTGLGVGFLAYLGIVAASCLLVVPGLMLFAMWAVALPAATVERTGVLESLSRSRALTQGRRWRVFWTSLIPILISLVVSWALIGLFGMQAIGSQTFQFVSWIVHAIDQAFSVCVFATLYYYLRREKEGVDIEQIGSVFD